MKSVRGLWMVIGAMAVHLLFVACGGNEGTASADGGGGSSTSSTAGAGGACACPAPKVEASIAVCSKQATGSVTAEHDYPGLSAQDLAARVTAVVPIDFGGLSLAVTALPLRFADGKVVAQCDGDSQTIIFLLR